jgi:general secretion pathway protein M
MRLAALEPWWDRGRIWWSGRSVREQILLGVLAVLGILALLMVLVVRPLEAARAQAAADIRTYEMLAMRVRAAGPALGMTAARRGPPSAVVAASAAAASVNVERVEPEGGRLTVVLGNAPFDNVLRFVADLEQTSALRIGEAHIEAGPNNDGTVNAQFVLTGGAA